MQDLKTKPDSFNQKGKSYPWETWFDAKQVTLRHGKEFHCTLSGMTINVRQAARRFGLRVRIDQGWDTLTVTVKGPI